MKVWLLLAGDYAAPSWSVAEHDIVIAVDGGMCHAAALGVMPDLWIGDFDSADTDLQQRYADVPRQTHPEDKDATDFELALAIVENNYPQAEVLSVIGGLGGELDHTFGNLWVLPHFGLSALVWGKVQHIAYLNSATLDCELAEGEKVSVFALTPLSGMHYSGLRWEAPADGLQPFSALAARNISAAEQVSIGWQQGHGLVILPQTAQNLRITH
ncbi:thiamine diphosphokinase [Cardiobacteriaceae bacterium TAE3-ERU3]|nr:thiamine diphosphokinase [Cardiobacteriaceae bacterium TAE3-ERU3]